MEKNSRNKQSNKRLNNNNNKNKKPWQKKGQKNNQQKRFKKFKTLQDKQAKYERRTAREINALNKQIAEMLPKPGINPFHSFKVENASQPTDDKKLLYFNQLPISKKTKDGLDRAGFTKMTEIQGASILHALGGRDILGAAKTGSGKTLAFLIPILENLYRKRWCQEDGLGALIITPARELALQIFEVLRTIGKFHGKLSAGLVVGGKNTNFEEEKKYIGKMNILVATPGRLLKHMESTYGFTCDNLQMLVLDEADRLLEMGFERDLTCIIETLPKDRQTLLFSATQTKSLKHLKQLSLKKDNTEYISVHEQEIVPKKLQQVYMICELQDKIDVLFSFISEHLHNKTIVFVSTAKQVSFLYHVFKSLNLGLAVCKLTGKISQNVRRESYEDFLKKKFAVLFATDVAARGLDFPRVDFVIQMDQPISPETYIHRVGRTARLNANGNAILFLTPQEKEFVDLMEKRGVILKEKRMSKQKAVTIKPQLEAMISNDTMMKFLAMKYYESYLVSLSKGCSAVKVDVNSLPLKEFAERLGLVEMPKVDLKSSERNEKIKAEQAKKLQELLDTLGEDDDEEEEEDDKEEESSEEGEEEGEEEEEEGGDIVIEDRPDLYGDSEEEEEKDEIKEQSKENAEELEKDESKEEQGEEGEEGEEEEEEGEEEDEEELGKETFDPTKAFTIKEVIDDDDEVEEEGEGEVEEESGDDEVESSESDDEIKKLEDDDEILFEKKVKKKKPTQIQKLLQRKTTTQFQDKYLKLLGNEEEEDADDLFTVKRVDHELDDDLKTDEPVTISRNKKIKIGNIKNKHTIFSDDGKQMTKFEKVVQEINNRKTLEQEQAEYAKAIRERMEKQDVIDKKLDKKRIREKKAKEKEIMKNIKLMKDVVKDLEEGIIRDPIALQAPTVVLGDADDEEPIEEEVEEEEVSEEEVEEKLKNKRKRESYEEERKIKKPKTLEEEEEIALQLLNERIGL